MRNRWIDRALPALMLAIWRCPQKAFGIGALSEISQYQCYGANGDTDSTQILTSTLYEPDQSVCLFRHCLAAVNTGDESNREASPIAIIPLGIPLWQWRWNLHTPDYTLPLPGNDPAAPCLLYPRLPHIELDFIYTQLLWHSLLPSAFPTTRRRPWRLLLCSL